MVLSKDTSLVTPEVEVVVASSGIYWLEILDAGKILQFTREFPEQAQIVHGVSGWEILVSD